MAVGGGLLLVVGLVAAMSIVEAFDRRASQRADVEKKLANQSRTLERAAKARRHLAELQEQRSLPGKVERASTLYRDWLSSTIAAAGLQGAEVKSQSRTSTTSLRSEPFARLTFNVLAEGNLDQLVHFLYDFNDHHHLHKIKSLKIPEPKGGIFQLNMVVEALVLRGVRRTDKLAAGRGGNLALGSLDEYRKIILGRNLFAPHNYPPQFASLRDREVNQQDTLRVSIRATNREKDQKVTYRLAEGAPSGATIGSDGSFRWTPTTRDKLGKYPITVLATDDGPRAEPVSATFNVEVKPPRPKVVTTPTVPKKPDLNEAVFTHVMALIDAGGTPQVWLSIRDTGQYLRLQEGDNFKAGPIEARVVRVSLHEAIFECAEKHWSVGLGDSFKDALPVKVEGSPTSRQAAGL